MAPGTADGGVMGNAMSDDFAYMTALELRRLIRTKQASPVAIVESALRRARGAAAGAQPVRHRHRRSRAGRRPPRRARGDGGRGRRHCSTGLPLSIKDLTAVKGVRFTSGSRTLADFIAPLDAPASERVKAHGAAILGKTTTTEFGCKASSDSPLTGITRNPWNLDKTTGGSSAGAGASVAAGITPFALGTDGGGSIRIPSSFCGLFGIKAQFGRVPVFPAAATPTLAHVGPMARTVRDAALLLTAVSGFDARDPASVAAEVPDYLGACERSPEGPAHRLEPDARLRPADRRRWRTSPARPARAFEQLGCTVELVEKVFDDPIELWMAEFYAGVGTRLKKPLDRAARPHRSGGRRDAGHARSIRPSRTTTRRVFARYEFREKVRAFFERFDLLMTPTTADAGLRHRPRRADRARGREHRRLGRLHLSVQSVRAAGRLGPVRVHARRPAGRPAHRVEGAARDRHPARRRGLRGGAAVGRPEAAARGATTLASADQRERLQAGTQ